MHEAKVTAETALRLLRPKLEALSTFLHSHPELGLQEEKACRTVADLLREEGFEVETGVAGLSTSVAGTWSQAPGKPHLAFLAEYDALPELGHACGHNLIAMVAVGAALATREAMRAHGLPGTVTVYGTPAEEGAVDGAGGKVDFLKAGLFRGIDACFIAHPSSRNLIDGGAGRGRVALEVTFHGKSAHAGSSPEQGVNALDAAVLAYSGWNALRQRLKAEARLHAVITDGGVSPNIVPARARLRLYVRAEDSAYLRQVEEWVKECARGVAQATGTRVEFRHTCHTYEPVLTNPVLGRLYRDNLIALGIQPDPPVPGGSSDAGNVSLVVPLIHPHFAICPTEIAGHTPEFAQAAAGPKAHQAAFLAAQALAMTALDLLLDPGLVEEAWRELRDTEASLLG
ncbi:MAG: M20 family peptidase [Bacillota bacterium]|nr:MAG: M20 family peptidase [Bacillota bacterium]